MFCIRSGNENRNIMFGVIKSLLDFIIKVLGDILSEIIGGIGSTLTRVPDHSFKDALHPPLEVVTRKAGGIAIGADYSLSMQDTYEGGLLVSGRPGSGKSVAVCAVTGLSSDMSFVFFDPSRTLYPVLAPWLVHTRGYDIPRVLDFTNPEVSEGYNPLVRIKNTADSHTVASIIMEPFTRTAKDPYWGREAANILALLIDLLLAQEEQYHNLYNLALLVNEVSGNRAKLDRCVVKCPHPTVFPRYKAMIAGMKSENTLSSLLSTIRGAMNVYLNEDVARVTSVDTLGDLGTLLRTDKKSCIIIQTPTMQADRLSGISSIFVSQLYSTILGNIPNPDDNGVLLVLDEYATLASSLLPQTVLFQANARKYRAAQVLGVQGLSQLSSVDRHLTDALKGMMNRMTFGAMALEEAQEISQILGRYSFIDDRGNQRDRILKTPTELRNLAQFESVLQVGSRNTILKATPYFHSRKYRTVSSLPSVELTRKLPVDNIPILPLD